MKLSNKTSIILSIVSIAVWAGLFALFYFSDNSYGNYGTIDAGQVRGAQAKRFELPEQEILIASKIGANELSTDRILLSKDPDSEAVIIRVIRDKIAIFEQKVSEEYSKAEFNEQYNRFEVINPELNTVFYLEPVDNGYMIVSLE